MSQQVSLAGGFRDQPVGYRPHRIGAALFRAISFYGRAYGSLTLQVAWPDEFIDYGKPDILRGLHHLGPETAVEKALARLA